MCINELYEVFKEKEDETLKVFRPDGETWFTVSCKGFLPLLIRDEGDLIIAVLNGCAVEFEDALSPEEQADKILEAYQDEKHKI